MTSRLFITLPIALLALLPTQVFAGGLILQASATDTSQTLAVLDSLELSVHLDDAGATVEETRRYRVARNDFGVEPVEVRFYRSLVGAGVDVLQLSVDDRALDFELLQPADADIRRRQLVTGLGQPGLLRELGSTLLQSDAVEVIDGYVTFHLTTRMDLSPRGTLRGVSIPIDWQEEAVARVSVDVAVTTNAQLRALYSPYHGLSVERQGAHDATAVHESFQVCTRFDVELLLSTGDDPYQLDLLPFRYGDEEGGYFMAMITPPSSVEEQSLVGRDLVITLDVSGSMEGEKMTAAKAALDRVLADLNPLDNFALFTFSNGVQSLGDGMRAATTDNVNAARALVEDLQAGGGTNIFGALSDSLGAFDNGGGRPRYLVLFTDGEPTEGETDIDLILELATDRNDGGVRIYPFGIGYKVNTRLLDELARSSAGHALYVMPGESVETVVADFFAGIRAPQLSAPALDLRDFGVTALHPEVLQDLFVGRTQTLLGRYATPGKGTIRLSGVRDGRLEVHSYDVTLPEYALDSGAVPRIWALRQVGALLEEIKLDGATDALLDDVLSVARRFGVVTEYTYFAQEGDDLVMTYSPVPTAYVGAAAVGASQSISGYGQSDAVAVMAGPTVRYFSDRSFPLQGGYYTDAKLGQGDEWIDVSFGSDLYYDWLAAEADIGAAGITTIGPDTRVELLGRRFRISDPSREDAAPETLQPIPEPHWRPTATPTSITYVGAEENADPEDVGRAQEFAVRMLLVDGPQAETGDSSGQAKQGCSVGTGVGGGVHGAPLALLLVFGLVGLLAQRRGIHHGVR